jgi:hypothetical protein
MHGFIDFIPRFKYDATDGQDKFSKHIFFEYNLVSHTEREFAII